MPRRRRILYVHSTLMPPPVDLSTDRFYLLSGELEGDILQPIWFQSPAQVEAMFGPGSYPVYTAGNFRYHWFLSSTAQGIGNRLATFWFYIRKGLEVYRQRRFECIVAYSHMTTGLFAGALKLLTGTRLITEIATTPHLVYITESPVPDWRHRIRKLYSDISLHLSMLLSNRAHFLFPDQLSPYPLLRKVRNSVFHEFVPVGAIDRPPPEENPELYALLVGAPWYLKGADVLIEAFLSLSDEFPEFKLRILGYFPDIEQLRSLAHGSTQIEFLKARPNPEAIEIIRRATVVVLPSRCEGMGRVLIEGMAAGIPLIGSNIGGIPFMIRDQDNGFIVPVGNAPALADRLRRLFTDNDMRRRMGARGYARAHEELNETVYVREFVRMVEATMQRSG